MLRDVPSICMTKSGRVVILNGTASAGKSTLAAAIRAAAPTMWVVIAQDDFAHNLIPRWVTVTEDTSPHASLGDGFAFVHHADGTTTVALGPIGRRLLRGYRQAVAAIARAGNDVLVDEAKFDDRGLADWQECLAGLDVTWVRVECDLAVCDARERARGDRVQLRGLARGLYEQVHGGVEYDLVVTTSNAVPEDCAETVLAALCR
jgi:chloramphenicol 3-O phosphotransferase